MIKRSAGLLMYRIRSGSLEVFLVHPGGPFWASRDRGAWTIPKGTINPDEQPMAAALREFQEETGFLPAAPYVELGSIRQTGGKLVYAWGFAGDCDPAKLVSNLCHVQWPPHSGTTLEIPEIDRGQWFPVCEAYPYILASQTPLLDRLQSALADAGTLPAPA